VTICQLIVHLLVIVQNKVDNLVQCCYPQIDVSCIVVNVEKKGLLTSDCPLRVRQWRVGFHSPTQTGCVCKLIR